MVERTEAHKQARLAAESIDISLERLIYKAIYAGVFIRPGTKDNYSLSWVSNRLRQNDINVAEKLENYSKTI